MPSHIHTFLASNRFRPLAIVLLFTLPLPGSQSAPIRAVTEGSSDSKPAAPPGAVEVRCTDGSVMRLKILDEKISFKTPYGKLLIPVTSINEIDFATRIPDDISRRVALAIVDLGNGEFKKREAASAELASLKIKAYPALLKAEKLKDPEVQKRTKELLEKIRKNVAEADLEVRDRDTIHTDDSRIAGQIEASVFRVETEQFGEVRLKLSDIRHLRSLAFQKPDTGGAVLPNPGHLHGYQAQAGKVFKFTVTGAVAGAVWGTDVYTLDSALAAAAVHAGIVQVGKTAVVKVRILPPRNGFVGSARNGVSTANYGVYPGAYEFVKD